MLLAGNYFIVTDLYTTVRQITIDSMVLENYRIIARVWGWFENIRKTLRVSRELNSKEKGETQDIGITGIELNRTLSYIIEEGEFAGGELKRISGIFRKRIEDHRTEPLSFRIIGTRGFGLMSFPALSISSFVMDENSFRKSIFERTFSM